jgi:D-sedoheptulose 7-phosphate isomerase
MKFSNKVKTGTLEAYEWATSKGVSQDDFLKTVNAYHAAGKRIITTNGCFDLLHVGHIQFLRQAKDLGDILIVGLNSDASVRQIKGSNRPILPEAERAAMLLALKSVDHVVIFGESLPNNLLEVIKPTYHCKAGDYIAEGLPEAGVVRNNGGEIRILPVIAKYSTSKTIEKILVFEKENDVLGEGGIQHQDGQPDEIMDFFILASNVLRQTGYRLADKIIIVADVLIEALKTNHKVLICGNGGSAADAQHFAAELVVRYKLDRQALPAISLTTDTSVLTACGNDYGFDQIFSRQVKAYGQTDDVLVAISTSGNSPNILAAIREAKELGLKVVGLTGSKKSQIMSLVDFCLPVPSEDTPLIQQAHTAILHILCDQIEKGVQASG